MNAGAYGGRDERLCYAKKSLVLDKEGKKKILDFQET